MNVSRPVTLIVLTHNRRDEVLRTLDKIRALNEAAAVCVIDNASRDGSADTIEAAFPDVRVIRSPRNLGAAARNAGVRAADTKYVAFCDDDTWWAPGALTRACALLDAHPAVGCITARILVGSEMREDPASRVMARSPLAPIGGFPGTQVAGFMAGACVMRRDAFLACGGYEPRFFIGGEEELLAIDLLSAGWLLTYAPEVVVHHHPSRVRDARGRRRLILRNGLWCVWLRRPLSTIWHESWRRIAATPDRWDSLLGVLSALNGVAWVWARRRSVPRSVETLLRSLAGPAESQRTQRPPRYIFGVRVR